MQDITIPSNSFTTSWFDINLQFQNHKENKFGYLCVNTNVQREFVERITTWLICKNTVTGLSGLKRH
jgi:hypothetical protein